MIEEKERKNRSYLPKSWGTVKNRKDTENDLDANAENSVSEDLEDQETLGPERSSFIEPKEALNGPQISEDPINVAPQIDDAVLDLQQPEEEGAPRTRSLLQTVELVGVRFGYACKIYNFDTGGLELQVDDHVVVKTEKGLGLGRVAVPPFKRELDPGQLEGLRKIIRKAVKDDFDQRDRCKLKEAEAMKFCLDRIEVLELPMKLISVECFFDSSKYVFYFTAEGRVDFRELVKQLVARFPVRIEMRQIGVRHEAKMTGGLACCGQELCCSRFLTDFRPVSVKMAKNQNLSLNPTKISGVCGRLMCCLGYEHDTYEEFKKGLPRVGKTIVTKKGEGVVLKHNPLAESIYLKMDDETIIEIKKNEVVKELASSRDGRFDDACSDIDDEPDELEKKLDDLR